METRPLLTLRLRLAPREDFGTTPLGARVTYPVVGGTFEGDRLRGTVRAGGADWVLVRPDSVMELDLRVTLETDDGALLHTTFAGIRDDSAGYFRTTFRFDTAAPKYAFLNRLFGVGSGSIGPDGPVHVVEELL